MANPLSCVRMFIGGVLCACVIAPLFAYADTVPSQADLEQQLAAIEAQIADLQNQLTTTQSAKLTLTKKINQLKTQQDKIRLQIKATTLQIKKLDTQIASTQASIQNEKNKINRYRAELTTLIRTLNSNERTPLLITFLEAGGTTAFFQDLQSYASITDSIHTLVQLTKSAKVALEQKQTDLSDQQDDAKNLLSVNIAQQNALKDSLGEQNDLLTETKGQEAAYQSQLADTRKLASQIRSRLYELFGTTKQIDFGDAVKIAQFVSSQTGVEPAFLLAILTQETNLGKNVGTCNRSGDPPEKGWRVIMKPERDQTPFQQITNDLGMDTDTTPVSCPLKDKNGKQYGWGGAMGPAQFIPSTWVGWASKVAAVTGKTANPWDIRDAFIAAALKLKADGADKTDDGKWKAAMRYFSGSTNTKYRFYGDNVLALTKKYEKDIQTISQ